MRFLRFEENEPEAHVSGFLSDWSIRKKLLVILIPAVVGMLVVTGIASHLVFTHYFSIALERNAIVLTLAQAHEIETLLTSCRDELSILATQSLDKNSLRDFLKSRDMVHGGRYLEVVFAGVDPGEQIYLLCNKGVIADIPVDVAALMKNSPLIIPKRAGELAPGDVLPTGPIDLFFPPTVSVPGLGNLSMSVFRFVTPVAREDGTLRGYLVLSLDAHAVRNILSLFTSTRSPLHGFPRAAESRYSFFFDDKGWILFQSENVEAADKELSVDMARAGLTGDQGRTGFETGFRPSAQHGDYWAILEDVRQNRSGLGRPATDLFNAKSAASEQFLGYAPVCFAVSRGSPPEVVGGIIYVDRSLLPRAAEFGQFNVMFGIAVASMLTVSLLIFFLSRIITQPILRLAREVTAMHGEGGLRRLELPGDDLETSVLKRAINDLMSSLAAKDQEIRRKEEYLRTVQSRETVRLDPSESTASRVGNILGTSPAITTLLSIIHKTAAADADVLVIGETGTGKELAAEAIHRQSARAGKPFISINCGALDENLLMDALFGHVKGAFSEAKSDRKGAFLAADGGTLHLDEIGNASPKVQQALLRALSVRRIRPVGSDDELEFDARVIAATNVNLKEKVQRGEFREDLFYRLQVLTIETPPLRERMEDIPVLAGHFLRQAAGFTGKGELRVSRGALEKLMRHDWPGNVRELKNCLTRSVALAEREVIFAEDVRFGDETPRLLPDDVEEGAASTRFSVAGGDEGEKARAWPALPEATLPKGKKAGDAPAGSGPAGKPAGEDGLNPRQRRALAGLARKSSISRQDYQRAAGPDVPPRTAQHDLKELVDKGMLRKSGRGPSTRYHPVPGAI
ncbi:sigma 54-interacting transcriptional regulator [Desulfolutivibrio sulfoxidireducens]|uniref:sigma 54-interacting transcriptional regulator n=1 Tax=Desulfolutivibrio sulfoxidireducens TaxID=2773299 RepID=UPI00159D8BC6|nr:sigma 54-interacting transcriptional regulator [Desulfolutivibrio sulfoxidireducens]QLA17487.1 AAA domain-containing protein [Desulfolutivibrio sulfoxidireducens]QLA21072.1 AAA domain-containing protein [Desulfolutivibrio sulfoxidireducens]